MRAESHSPHKMRLAVEVVRDSHMKWDEETGMDYAH